MNLDNSFERAFSHSSRKNIDISPWRWIMAIHLYSSDNTTARPWKEELKAEGDTVRVGHDQWHHSLYTRILGWTKNHRSRALREARQPEEEAMRRRHWFLTQRSNSEKQKPKRSSLRCCNIKTLAARRRRPGKRTTVACQQNCDAVRSSRHGKDNQSASFDFVDTRARRIIPLCNACDPLAMPHWASMKMCWTLRGVVAELSQLPGYQFEHIVRHWNIGE